MKRSLVVFLIALIIQSCSTGTQENKKPMLASDFYQSQLYKDVELAAIFPDSKTFPDCKPKTSFQEIITAYNSAKKDPDFNLNDFVNEHFDMPYQPSDDFVSDTSRSMIQHINDLWPVLTRQPDKYDPSSSLLPLPNPYVVPGGRFREIYYWDSYFTMLGLAESGKYALIEDMLDNFAYLINTVGHIPNGNRSYYITRSQPPFYAQMVRLLAEKQGDSIYRKYRAALRKEYEFWMEGSDLTNTPLLHCVGTPVGILNRYFDKGTTPRQESYKEDYRQVESLGGGAKMYSDLRSCAESGWDFSSRWFKDGATLKTIETTDIIPVDLNALLYGLEEVLIHSYPEDAAFVAALKTQMAVRKEFLDEYCWDEKQGIYLDYDWVDQTSKEVPSLAMAYPLYFGMASTQQADKVAAYIQAHFLKAGGVVATENHTGEQWDAPNGWAPLEWMTIMGLERNGHHELARTIAQRWVDLNEKVYANTGKFVEKYNVEDMSLKAGGGEYPVQDGFGWSNGVYLALKAYLEKG